MVIASIINCLESTQIFLVVEIAFVVGTAVETGHFGDHGLREGVTVEGRVEIVVVAFVLVIGVCEIITSFIHIKIGILLRNDAIFLCDAIGNAFAHGISLFKLCRLVVVIFEETLAKVYG